jgi:Relaxase/Mobilisation nuclease domain
MRKRVVTLTGPGRPAFEIISYGRGGPATPDRFSPAMLRQIARTVRYVPEVMVKVTGGGTTISAVSAHVGYIGREGELEIRTDDGERITNRDQQKALLKTWHLELIAGQYRRGQSNAVPSRPVKLVHNIVLSMPAPTSAEKVHAAAQKFASEKFPAHRYLMALHTDQQHPHVHLVVKSESEYGRRLRIDKQMLREWREDFAAMMREQGVAANATSRAVRGRNRRKSQDRVFRARRHGAPSVLREQVGSIARELKQTGTVRDPARPKLVQTRKALVSHWLNIADSLHAQGEAVLAGEVRQFAARLPPVLTDRERIAVQLIRHLKSSRSRALDQEMTR